MPTNELKPCPFCGGEAEIIEVKDNPPETIAIQCKSGCGVSARHKWMEENVLIEAWNTRAESTCRNVAEQGVLFECSECGAKTVDAVGNYTQEYCAACGSKVQDAD